MNRNHILIRHIHDEVSFITSYLNGVSYEEFNHNLPMKKAVLQSLMVIGEAANQMDSDFSAEHPEIEIEVVPGITAACSGAAVLGAPLIADFCLISLSDLMTPWEKIAKRLDCASQADFCIALYNPSSKTRYDYLQKACDIMLKNQPASIPAGIVRNIGREGQAYELTTLGELRDKQVDMFSTVIIGNTQSQVINGRIVTPRGYKLL